MNEDAIRIIVTGGTFDKAYDELRGELTFRESHLPEIIKQIRCTVPIVLETNQLIDSLNMGDEQRARVLEACVRCPERRILVTHGTDTMVETARLIGAASVNKTIILTGAMVPYSVSGSDALFNLGCGFAAVQLLPAGVYIAMNGRVFPHDRVKKNRERGLFEPLA